MRITVKSFGMVKSALGQKEMTLNLPEEATVRDAINQLIEMRGAEARDVLLAPGGDSLKVRAIINGKPVLLESSLQDEVELNLMLTIGGGSCCSPGKGAIQLRPYLRRPNVKRLHT